MTEQEKQPVVQSNDLVSAHYKLDLVAQKLLRFLISMIKPSDSGFEKNYYRVEISNLLDYLGWEKTGKIYREIREVARSLMTRPIKIIKPGETIETTWIASFRYPKNMGWIEFEFSSRLESELLKLKDQFTKYYLKNISKLKSQYSIRLYELLRQYLSVGKREIEIEDLKSMLGIEKDEYEKFNHLKTRVIEKSAKEITRKTDLDFKVKYIREARKVVAVLFYDIQQKTHIPASIMSLIPKKYRENKQLLDIVRRYIELMGEDYVIEKLNYTNSKNPERYVDYLYRCLEENWGAGFVPGQEPIPGILESIEDGTVFEISGERYRFEAGFVKIKDRVIPEGYLRKMLAEGKARIVQEPPED
ncbi:MAG: replication initiation protein [Candidatus Hadarchaeales archaeon]